jgi:hypothetical protein
MQLKNNTGTREVIQPDTEEKQEAPQSELQMEI